MILWIDLVLLAFAGSELNIHPDRTGEFFAWVIPVALTAAFLGAGYWVALPSLIMAIRKTGWTEIRIVLFMGVTLATVELIVTVRDFGAFLLLEGPALARIAAWVWVIAYFTLPPLNVAGILLNRRTATPRPPTDTALRPWAVAVLAVYAVVLTGFGLGMLFFSGAFDGVWPWPVSRLTAGAVSGWLLTLAVGCWWWLRERSWTSFRIVVPFYVLWFLAQILTVARFREDLAGGAGAVAYVAALAVSVVVFIAIGLIHERAARAMARRATPAPA